MKPVVIFSHGKESGPKATKIVAMQDVVTSLGLKSYSLDYQGMETVDERLEKLQQFMQSVDRPFILVGSSMGAYVSLKASQLGHKVFGLFLLAPAIGLPGYEVSGLQFDHIGVQVIHGWQDDIVPVDKVTAFCKEHRLSIDLRDDDHRLSRSIPYIKNAFNYFLTSIVD